jgi:hypothetical protein
LWLTFGVVIAASLVGATVWSIRVALQADTLTRAIAAAAWSIAFVFSWWAFRRSHGSTVARAGSETPRSATWRWLARWGPVLGVAVATLAAQFSNNTQLIFLAVVTGFAWPMLYWIVRALVKNPDRRERLWQRSPFAPPE